MSTAAVPSNWAAQLKALNLAFAARESQLNELLHAAQTEHAQDKQRLAERDEQARQATSTLEQLREQLKTLEAEGQTRQAALSEAEARAAQYADSWQGLKQRLHEAELRDAEQARVQEALRAELKTAAEQHQHGEQAAIEREHRLLDEFQATLKLASDSAATLTQTLATRERDHSQRVAVAHEQVDEVGRRLQASNDLVMSLREELVRATQESLRVQTAADVHERSLTQELDRARAESARLSVEIQAGEAHRQRVDELETAERGLRQMLEAQLMQARGLQAELDRLRGLFAVRVSEGVRRLFVDRAQPATTPHLPLVHRDTSPIERSDAAISETTSTPITRPPAYARSESPVPASPPPIVHVHQLMRLRGRAFVEAAYVAVLGRQPDPRGGDHFLARVNTDQDKAQILFELATSNEGRARRQTVPGLQELVDSKHTGRSRLRQWLQRQTRADLSINRVEAALGGLGDEMDERLRALDDRLTQLAVDSDLPQLGQRVDAISEAVHAMRAALAADLSALAKSQQALAESQALLAQSLVHESRSVTTVAPLRDALACSLSAEAGAVSLVDSLAQQLAATVQARTLSTN